MKRGLAFHRGTQRSPSRDSTTPLAPAPSPGVYEQGGSGTSRNAGRSRAAASCAHQSSRPDGDSYPSAGGVATKMTRPGHSVIVGRLSNARRNRRCSTGYFFRERVARTTRLTDRVATPTANATSTVRTTAAYSPGVPRETKRARRHRRKRRSRSSCPGRPASAVADGARHASASPASPGVGADRERTPRWGDQAEAYLSPRLLNGPQTDTTVVPRRVARVGHFAGLASIESSGMLKLAPDGCSLRM
jgi:hypothetical protein